ncbi:hypothetical protein Peur_045401 [Populus x canadensis]
MHLLTKGFMEDYMCWYAHGELFVPDESMEEQVVGSTSSASNMHEVENENSNPYRNMVMDATRMSEANVRECPIVEEEPYADAARFFDLLRDSDEPLWDGCTNHSKLSAVAQVFTIKSDHGLSEAGYDKIIEWAISILPEGNRLKENFYAAKSMMKPLGLGYQKIDICPNFCMLYYLENAEMTECMTCGHSRYKPRTDGFNPFGSFAAPYSCWPVILTVYNLPPGMCMRPEFMFLSMVIPGPSSPGRNIDVCLRPLIDELTQLWSSGALTYDISRKQNFVMRAALMWTINDFPAYGMVSGWSTHGKLACPYCMENNKAFTLTNGGKASFFYYHRRFLPHNHRYRKNRKDFFVGRVENDVAPPRLSGEELFDVVSEYGEIVFGLQSGKQKFPGFGLTYNWVKRSIFWELPYWKTNLLRHNLDVMHIEKNVFENIFNTVMDVKGKTKDNIKARLDVALFCNRKNMELVCDGSRVAKPRASFVLDKNAQLLVYKWLKSLRFLDGHASNISRLVNTKECRLYGMKSHDCHVFMQTLIPLAFRDLLPKGIWDALTEISHFFRDICSSKLNVDHIERLEKNIVETICKLEMIFPPSFFDSMEHLPVHLPFEVKVGGPVQYRWMYPFERLDIIVAMTFIIKCFYFYFNVFN